MGKIKTFKLFESITSPGIWKIKTLKDVYQLGYDSDSHRFKHINFSKKNIIDKVLSNSNTPYEYVEESYEGLVIHFTQPKEYDSLGVNFHIYSPAETYYTIRISEHDDDWFLLQWFGQLFATEQHIINHYNKYPNAKRTYIDQNDIERPAYAPPIYKDYKSSQYSGDSFGSSEKINFYLCDGIDSLTKLINDFINFLDTDEVRFETKYPLYEI